MSSPGTAAVGEASVLPSQDAAHSGRHAQWDGPVLRPHCAWAQKGSREQSCKVRPDQPSLLMAFMRLSWSTACSPGGEFAGSPSPYLLSLRLHLGPNLTSESL